MLRDYLMPLVTNPGHMIGLFILVLARMGAIITTVPFLGAKLLPNMAKVALAISLSLMMLPYVSHVSGNVAFNATLIFFVIKEFLIGFILGFLAQMPFNMAQMAGIVIDHQRGSSSLMVTDPSQGIQVSTIGLLYSYMIVCSFFWLNGPFVFLDAVVKSYHVLPPDALPSALMLQWTQPLSKTFLGLMTYLTALSCQLAAPSLLMILMSNVFLGIMNRLAPQVQISFLGMALNAYLGDMAMWAAWYFIIERLGIEAMKWMTKLTSLLDTVLIAPS